MVDDMNSPVIQAKDFATLLESIEGFDEETRRAAVARLEQIGGNKAFQVARVLVGDADLVVAATARRICKNIKGSGRAWNGIQRLAPPAETKALKDRWQLLDEVVFIIRRNLSEIVICSFLVAVPKLLFVLFAFVGPYFIKNMGSYINIYSLVAMIFLHQLFWRPIAWLTIGKAFLSGFADRATRQSGRKKTTFSEYISMVLSNSVVAIPYSLLLAHSINTWLNHGPDGTDILLWAGFWIIFWEMTFFANSVVLFPGSRHSVLEGIFLRFRKSSSLFATNMFFLAVLACLYGAFYASSIACNLFLGVSLQPGSLPIPGNLWFISFWVMADCFVDPFIIGYKLLMTRICLNRSEA